MSAPGRTGQPPRARTPERAGALHRPPGNCAFTASELARAQPAVLSDRAGRACPVRRSQRRAGGS